jgi:hypothetical protein
MNAIPRTPEWWVEDLCHKSPRAHPHQALKSAHAKLGCGVPPEDRVWWGETGLGLLWGGV